MTHESHYNRKMETCVLGRQNTCNLKQCKRTRRESATALSTEFRQAIGLIPVSLVHLYARKTGVYQTLTNFVYGWDITLTSFAQVAKISESEFKFRNRKNSKAKVNEAFRIHDFSLTQKNNTTRLVSNGEYLKSQSPILLSHTSARCEFITGQNVRTYCNIMFYNSLGSIVFGHLPYMLELLLHSMPYPKQAWD